MSQSNYSKIESDKQDVDWEQIEQLARVFETTPESLIHHGSPVINIENQHGGSANNYYYQAATEEAVLSLKDLRTNRIFIADSTIADF